MKVILVNSPLFRDRNELYEEDALPPLGLGYIATQLELMGVDVELIDAVNQRLPLVELSTMLRAAKPDFLAVNIFTTNYELVKELIEGLGFSTHIIIGGLSTKHLYNPILSWTTDNPIDIVTGDGEYIVKAIVRGEVTDSPVFAHQSRRVFQIDGHSSYLVHDISSLPLNRHFFSNEPVLHPLGFREANIVASRGCVYNCTFCAAARSLNKDYPVRERTPESLIDELREIAQAYPDVNSIRVLDDLFLKSNASVEKAIEVFSNFSFQWRSMAHVQTFRQTTDQMMRQLKGSGCFELFIGIESGSPKILAQINKTKDVDVIVGNLSKVFRAGINVKGYFIYGFPEETAADMEQTFALAQQLKDIATHCGVNFRTSVFQYRPYHGTQIYHDLEMKGVPLDVTQTSPNPALSDLVGRQQFNFHSGNYAAVGSQVVESYIYRTINLNGGKPFSNLVTKTSAL